MGSITEDIRIRAGRIKLLLLDVDGVLTDGRIYLGPRGEELKAFHVRDGSALVRLLRAGLAVALISGRRSKAVLRRGRELGIGEIHQGVKDKAAVLAQLLQGYSCGPEEAAYVGDDLPDLEIMREVGLSVAVADAHPQLQEAADYVTEKRGGEGAVMEIAELILDNLNE